MPDGEEVLEQDENVQDGEIVTSDLSDVSDQEADDTTEEVADEVVPEPVQEKPRPVYTMPVAKAQEEKQRAVDKAVAEAKAQAEADRAALQAEYEAKLAAVTPSDYQQEIDKVAAEHGLDPKAAADLLGVMERRLKGSLPDLSKYDTILKDQELQGHKAQVAQEFDDKVAPLILKEFPQASPAHIRDVKERIAELAFTPGYNTYRLEDIYKINRDDFRYKTGYSAEASGGHTTEIVDFSKVTDDEEIAMAKNSPETYKKLLKWQASHGSKFLN